MNNRVKVKRAEHDLTQQDLADKIGVSRQTINAIEKGKYDPSLPIAFKLAAVFQCQIEDLFIPE
ncbi:helix-turn-helix transcriptional regulator [Pleionea litopenaei]|uniref:Helix-turn-helix transcriptional regulator n=1 Tax=Pleionea litopenaei TaxID=3070815 RepID=A0AA51RVN5_9GAMM|nr:helix-turn-helix transcriptional regulator [Pleionea sp. HL-JVS1]WMS88354.1 helix-turn-helix transcriptional regulator [Pleionea sp. HL-JVS1]